MSTTSHLNINKLTYTPCSNFQWGEAGIRSPATCVNDQTKSTGWLLQVNKEITDITSKDQASGSNQRSPRSEGGLRGSSVLVAPSNDRACLDSTQPSGLSKSANSNTVKQQTESAVPLERWKKLLNCNVCLALASSVCKVEAHYAVSAIVQLRSQTFFGLLPTNCLPRVDPHHSPTNCFKRKIQAVCHSLQAARQCIRRVWESYSARAKSYSSTDSAFWHGEILVYSCWHSWWDSALMASALLSYHLSPQPCFGIYGK